MSRVNDAAASEGGKKRLLIIPRIICLLIAFVIWVYVVNITAENYEKTFTMIDIKTEGADKLIEKTNMSIYDVSESKVSVTVSGSRKDISQLSSADFIAYIDVSDISGTGRNNVSVKVSVPSSVSMLSFSPSAVEVMTDKRETREFRVTPIIENYSLRSGVFRINNDKIRLSRETVSVTGPVSVLEKVGKVIADVNFNGESLTFSKTFNAPLKVVDSDGNIIENQFLSVNADTITVDIPVIEKKTVALDIDTTGADPSVKFTAFASPSVVTVEGDSSVVSSLSKIYVYKIIGSGDVDVPVKLTDSMLPADVSFIDAPPEIQVKVVFAKAPETNPPETKPETPEVTEEPEETGDNPTEVTKS